jgi:hypothetical protein
LAVSDHGHHLDRNELVGAVGRYLDRGEALVPWWIERSTGAITGSEIGLHLIVAREELKRDDGSCSRRAFHASDGSGGVPHFDEGDRTFRVDRALVSNAKAHPEEAVRTGWQGLARVHRWRASGRKRRAVWSR